MSIASSTPVVTVAVWVVCLPAVSCSKVNVGNGDAGIGAGVGESCDSHACRAGLRCEPSTRTCSVSGSVIQGGACTLSAECLAGNYCTQQGACAPSGKLPAGSACSSEGDCVSGLACTQSGLSGACQTPGAADLGRGCSQTADCMAGLLCVAGICGKGATSVWAGVECSSIPESATKVFFHVPRSTELVPTTDFYRLPFPNDIRFKNGKVSLAGHPKPGPRILPLDLVDRYLTAVEADASGFSANPTVFFRFSKVVNVNAFPFDCGVTLLDITPESPGYGDRIGMACGVVNSNTRYVCGPYLWLRPSLGSPLRAGATYAVLLRRELTDELGNLFGPDADFAAMLAATEPADPDLAVAYAAYLPLRKYIAAGKAPADLASAAVFTVENYEAPLAAVEAGVAAAAVPQVEGMVRCGDPAAVSPCDDGKTGADHLRGCTSGDAASATFDTYQGLVTLPVFQNGTAPYLNPSDGGAIQIDGATKTAKLVRTEKVCFALTVPKGLSPASGWPMVVYSHGTGGSYRSAIDLGLSADLASGVAPAGVGVGVDGGTSANPVPMAVLGYDGILHGTRNGGATKAVGELVYNFLNPAAARDNGLQAAADLMAIPRALPALAARGIVLDGKRLALYGHSQGGNAASLAAARQSAYGAIVMSGTGGELIYTLLGKLQPINIPAVLPYLLGEPGPTAVIDTHPALGLMQMYFDRSDSVNFARRLFREPLVTMTAHHVLHVYGTKDAYSVVATQQAYALAAGFHQATIPALESFGIANALTPPPLCENEFFGSYGMLTAGQVQYQSDGTYDGHFVSTNNPTARATIQEMLVTFARDGIPTIAP